MHDPFGFSRNPQLEKLIEEVVGGNSTTLALEAQHKQMLGLGNDFFGQSAAERAFELEWKALKETRSQLEPFLGISGALGSAVRFAGSTGLEDRVFYELSRLQDELAGGRRSAASSFGGSALLDAALEQAHAATQAFHAAIGSLSSRANGLAAHRATLSALYSHPDYESAAVMSAMQALIDEIPVGTDANFSSDHLVRSFEEISNVEGNADQAANALISIIKRFIANSDTEVKNIGVLTALNILIAVISLLNILAGPELATRDDIKELRAELDQTRDDLEQVALADLRRSNALASLPRARALRTARLRLGPARQAQLVWKLSKDDAVVIVDKQGRWLRVAYRDTVTDDLRMAWVYSSVMEEYAPPDASK